MNIRTEPKCPDCYEIMVLRTRKSDGVKFWGCSTWPECTGTRNSDGTPEEDDDIFDSVDYDDGDWHPGHPSNYG